MCHMGLYRDGIWNLLPEAGPWNSCLVPVPLLTMIFLKTFLRPGLLSRNPCKLELSEFTKKVYGQRMAAVNTLAFNHYADL